MYIVNNWHYIDQCVKKWLQEVRKNIMDSLETNLDIKIKENLNDLVTNVDRETEEFFVHNIRSTFPHHKILGEEGKGDTVLATDGVLWIIDPIDGTLNFIHQKRNFFISIGVFENGIGQLGYLYDVVLDELYYAIKGKGAFINEKKLPQLEEGKLEEAIIGFNSYWISTLKKQNPLIFDSTINLIQNVRGVRSYGSAAMEFAYVATGRMDAYISLGLSPWDYAGGYILIEELGGKVTTLSGQPIHILEKSSIIAAKPNIHKKIVENFFYSYSEKSN